MLLIKCLPVNPPEPPADFCILFGEDRMIRPWHSFKTGRMKVLNHCFIEGKLWSAPEDSKNPGSEV